MRLQEIIDNKPVPDNDPLPETSPIEINGITPSNEDLMTAIPRNHFNWSFLDMSISLFGQYMRFSQWCSDVTASIVSVFDQQMHGVVVRSSVKMLQKKREEYIRKQVRAMVPHIVHFTYRPTLWEVRSSLQGNYHVRGEHRIEYNRHITFKTNQEDVA